MWGITRGDVGAALKNLAVFFAITMPFLLLWSYPSTSHVEGWVVQDAYIEARGCNRTTLLIDLGAHQEIRYYEGNWTGHRNEYVTIDARELRTGPCRGIWNVTAFSTNAKP